MNADQKWVKSLIVGDIVYLREGEMLTPAKVTFYLDTLEGYIETKYGSVYRFDVDGDTYFQNQRIKTGNHIYIAESDVTIHSPVIYFKAWVKPNLPKNKFEFPSISNKFKASFLLATILIMISGFVLTRNQQELNLTDLFVENTTIDDFDNCQEAIAAGFGDSPVQVGHKFERDNDGIACED